MVVAKLVIIIVAIGVFLWKLPWIYAKFISTTDEQMDEIAKTNARSSKRAAKRDKIK